MSSCMQRPVIANYIIPYNIYIFHLPYYTTHQPFLGIPYTAVVIYIVASDVLLGTFSGSSSQVTVYCIRAIFSYFYLQLNVAKKECLSVDIDKCILNIAIYRGLTATSASALMDINRITQKTFNRMFADDCLSRH